MDLAIYLSRHIVYPSIFQFICHPLIIYPAIYLFYPSCFQTLISNHPSILYSTTQVSVHILSTGTSCISSFQTSIHPCIHPSSSLIYQASKHLYLTIYSATQVSKHPSISPHTVSTRTSYQAIQASIHSLIYAAIPLIYPSVHILFLHIHLMYQTSNHPSIYQSIHISTHVPSLHPTITPSIPYCTTSVTLSAS